MAGLPNATTILITMHPAGFRPRTAEAGQQLETMRPIMRQMVQEAALLRDSLI